MIHTNYLDLLPDDIISYIYQLVDDAYLNYFNHFCKFIFSMYRIDVALLAKTAYKPSIVFIYCSYTHLSLDSLYKHISLFNHRYKYFWNIHKSLFIIDKFLSSISRS